MPTIIGILTFMSIKYHGQLSWQKVITTKPGHQLKNVDIL